MCLIIASQSGKLPNDKDVISALGHNPHGWGVARVSNGSILVDKGMGLNALTRAIKRCAGLPYMAHLRFATHGAVNIANTHPFKIVPGLFMAHNGILDIPITNHKLSDTAHFAAWVGDYLNADPDWWDEDSFKKDLEDWIGVGNKLTFLHAKSGEVRIVNKKAGWQDGEIWYSNTYSLDWGLDSQFDYLACWPPKPKVQQRQNQWWIDGSETEYEKEEADLEESTESWARLCVNSHNEPLAVDEHMRLQQQLWSKSRKGDAEPWNSRRTIRLS